MSVARDRRAGAPTTTPMQSISAQQFQQQRHSTADQADESDPDGQNLISLVELLQTYPGLLDDKVETVARALTQATLAATEVSLRNVGRRQLPSLQWIRMSKSLVPALASRAATVAAATNAQTRVANEAAARLGRATTVSGDQMVEGSTSRCAQKSGRRWFTQQHLQRLQSQGIVFTKGKFTAEENAVIDSAISAFVAAHGLDRQGMYGHLFKKKTLNSSDKQLRKLFWPILAEALPARQIQAIYHHVRRKYHPHNYMGAWTAGEDDELCRLVAAHGLAWETIAQQMGRTGTNCRDHWRYIRYGPRSQGLPQQQQQQQQHQAQDPVLLGVSSAVSRNVEAANKAGQSICGDSAGDVAPIVPT